MCHRLSWGWGICISLVCRQCCCGPSTHRVLERLAPLALLSLFEVVDSSLYCRNCHRVVTAMTAMVGMHGVPNLGDAYTMNGIADDVPMATLAVTACVVEISILVS